MHRDFTKLLSICIISLLNNGLCQRYAERNPLPAAAVPPPLYEDYDDYATEAYEYDDMINRWNVIDYPHPRKNLSMCGVEKPSSICDPDGILDKTQVKDLESDITSLYNKTPCICEQCTNELGGIVVGIALLKNVFQPYNVHPVKIVRSFAENVRKSWKLGSCDNDILIVVITDDRLSYTDVGKTTSYYVSLSDAHAIFVENKAHFSNGNFYGGLKLMLKNYDKNTQDLVPLMKDKKLVNVAMVTGIIIGVVFLIGFGILIFALVWYYKKKKTRESNDADGKSAEEGIPSGWKRKDIKVLFNSLITTNKSQLASPKYQPCETEEKPAEPQASDTLQEPEHIDTSLQMMELINQPKTTPEETRLNATNPEQNDFQVRIQQPNDSSPLNKEYRGLRSDL